MGWARRPALDGLRAVALLLVLLFHGGVGLVGGALGVDLFLVLSGYLITGLLLAERERSGRVDLPAFWRRRMRRLLPAILVLVGVVALVGTVDRLDGVAALSWWSNWRFALGGASYFDAFAAPSPLRHTWSLAVEEQWYVVWPGLCWLLAARARGRFLLPAVVGLALASAGAMWALAGDLDRAHMGTDTRAQGLLAGAAVAVVFHRRPLPRVGPATVAGLAGAAVVLGMAWRTPGTAPWLYRGGHLLVAAAGAALVVACLLPRGPIHAALSWRPLRAVGRLSYGAYLWHWPIYLWLTPGWTGLDRWPLLAVRLGATAVATVLSWVLVEQPVLEGRPLPRPHLALPAAVGAALVVVVAASAVDPAARPQRSALAAAEPILPEDFALPPPTSVPVPKTGVPARAAPAAPNPLDVPRLARPIPIDEPVVTVVGDSSAWALGWDVEPVAGMEIHDGAGVGCGLDPAGILVNGAVHVEAGLPVPCDQHDDLWRWWTTRTDPDVVFLALGAWEVYDRQLPDGSRLDVGTPEWERWIDEGLERAGAMLAAAAPHAVIAVADIPCYAERDLALGGPTSPRNDPERQDAVEARLAAFVERHPARLASVAWSAWLCGPDAPARPDGVHLVSDSAIALWEGPLGDAVVSLARGSGATGSAPVAPS